MLKEKTIHELAKESPDKTYVELEAQEALANALEVNESHQKLNGKLQERLTELEQENIELHADNIKLARQIEDKLDQLRKAGM
tara:strand:- start:801 stop:1049 length:249 start_codon:yes stop_codon:yes gene_type:complete